MLASHCIPAFQSIILTVTTETFAIAVKCSDPGVQVRHAEVVVMCTTPLALLSVAKTTAMGRRTLDQLDVELLVFVFH
jgi:hypothetical protein